jgi:hypothetical protein
MLAASVIVGGQRGTAALLARGSASKFRLLVWILS